MVSTTIASGSNNVALPTATINVASTTGFSTSGNLLITTSNGLQLVAYGGGGGGGTQFTTCHGGTGTMLTGNAVVTWVSTDEGSTIELPINNENYITSAQGIIGNPTSSGGNYVLPITISDNLHGGLDTLSVAFLGEGLSASGGPTIPLPAPVVLVTYYKMVGYYTSGSFYESFVMPISPSPASVTNPNTGHALVNTRVAASWTV